MPPAAINSTQDLQIEPPPSPPESPPPSWRNNTFARRLLEGRAKRGIALPPMRLIHLTTQRTAIINSARWAIRWLMNNLDRGHDDARAIDATRNAIPSRGTLREFRASGLRSVRACIRRDFDSLEERTKRAREARDTRRLLLEDGKTPSFREFLPLPDPPQRRELSGIISLSRYNCRSLPRQAFLPVFRSRRAVVPCANLSRTGVPFRALIERRIRARITAIRKNRIH